MATKAEKAGRVSIMTKQQKKTLNLVLTYLVIILIGRVLLFPIAWMISARNQTNDEIFGSIALMPVLQLPELLLTAGKAPVFIPMQPISSTLLSWSSPPRC